MRVYLIVLVVVALLAYWFATPSDPPPREHFGSTRSFEPSRLFFGPSTQSFKVKSDLATINAVANVQENAAASRAVTAVVLFLHGMPESARTSWDSTVSLLEKTKLNARKLIYCAFDLRGFNQSFVDPNAPLAAFGVDYSVVDLVKVVEALRERFVLDDDFEVHLVSHDLGALAVWAAWQRSSLKDNLKSATVVNVPHLQAYWGSLFNTDQLLRSWYIFFFQLPSAMISRKLLGNNAALLQRSFTSTRKGSYFVGDLDDLIKTWLAPGALESMLNYYRGILFHSPCMTEHCLSDAKKPPINIVWGMKDWVFASKDMICGSKLYAEKFGAPTVNLYPLPDTNHYVTAEKPEVLAAVVADAINGGIAESAAFMNNTFCN